MSNKYIYYRLSKNKNKLPKLTQIEIFNYVLIIVICMTIFSYQNISEVFKIYTIGKAKIIPSIRSNRPPWPGKMFPESLTLFSLLKYEINKSPNWHDSEIIKEKNIFFDEIKK